MGSPDFDVAVVGAGPAGTICALQCARMGLRTALLEKGAEGPFGRACVTEVAASVFHRCGVAPPQGDEIAYDPYDSVSVHSPTGNRIFAFPPPRIVALRLDRTVLRFAARAREAGVDVRFGVTVDGPVVDAARVTGVRARSPEGAGELTARLVVDATGNRAELVRQLPRTCGLDFSDRSRDTVIAQSRVYDVDVDALQESVAAGRLEPEVMRHTVAVQGSYAVLGVMVSARQRTAYLLAGIKRENTPPGPTSLLDQCAEALGVLGQPRFQAVGEIRIRRASLKLVCDGFAAIGEAAGMVVPIHASGVALGMLAGYELAEVAGRVLADGAATTTSLWPFAAGYQRRVGAIMATYDLNRRFLESLDVEDELVPLLDAGFLRASDMRDTLLERPLRIGLSSLPARMRAALRAPRLASRMLAVAPRLAGVRHHWQRYPASWDPHGFARWSREAQRLVP